ncbi:AraC family transcriptional regulator [Novosphingobium resinovorum]|uniref:AraC family transcriptional regulator n=1 Tax=Novosphingobium resinovorum TaxID=158500 RepID=UPI002ED66D14|nr:AraC family transcriptional regulator [Novosphingobium resinovorum]
MGADDDEAATELVDFSFPVSTDRLSLDARMSHSGVHVVRGSLAPNEGGEIGATQLSAVVHKGEPFEMEWRLPGSDRLHSRRIEFGDIHINPGDTPFFQRWTGRPLILGMALDHALIDRVGQETFGRGGSSLQTLVGIRDDWLMAAAKAWREELAAEGSGGRLVAEHMGVLLAIRLFRRYSDAAWRPVPPKGGLGARRLRLVIDYIEAHLGDDLSMSALAAVTGLSLHHFGEAFRQSTGIPPHRFVLIRRIERAKIFLLTTDMTITEVSFAIGYASQSHFALKFREMTGVGPHRFRLDRLT